MAVTTNKVGAGELTIGDSTAPTVFTSQVTSCVVTPSVDTGDALLTLSGESVAGDTSRTWTLDCTILQDLGATDSVVEFCWSNAGETFPFSFTPNTSKGKKVEGTLVVEAVAVGGEVGTKATSEFSFAIVGQPAITAVV